MRHITYFRYPTITQVISFNVNDALLVIGLPALPEFPSVYFVFSVLSVTKHEHDYAAHVGKVTLYWLCGVVSVLQGDTVKLTLY